MTTIPDTVNRMAEVRTIDQLADVFELLDPEQREKLNRDLAEMARLRRRAETEAANWPMP